MEEIIYQEETSELTRKSSFGDVLTLLRKSSFTEITNMVLGRRTSSLESGNPTEKLKLLRDSFKLISEKEDVYLEIELNRTLNWRKVLELCEKYETEDDLLIKVWKYEASREMKKSCSLPEEIFSIEESDDSFEMLAAGKAFFLIENYEESYRWLKISAELDNPIGQLNFGYLLEGGLGCEKNIEEAISWYKKSAKLGYFKAQYHLGYIYESAIGVEENDKKAFKYFKRAAEQGYAYGENKVGWYLKYKLFSEDEDIDYNEEARKWWKKAASQGCEQAIDYLSINF
eukprot:gene3536-6271_t